MRPIRMTDLQGQYARLKSEIDTAIQRVLTAGDFIQGSEVTNFERELSAYLDAQVISCGNGTDGLQIAMMALGLKPGDEVIIPAFTYVATAEVIALLRLVPVFADVLPGTYNLDVNDTERKITDKTAAIVPVHLFGQCADMQSLLSMAERRGIAIVEDAAQSLGSEYQLKGKTWKAGTMGRIGMTSFFPTKNLGAYGDGGAMITRDADLAQSLRMIANHGQKQKYHHDVIGVNSRLDTMQAAILRVKLQHLDHVASRRRAAADFYDRRLEGIAYLKTPERSVSSTHVFHQYTVVVREGQRDKLRDYLADKGVPAMIYYPVPLHLQKAYRLDKFPKGSLPVAERLSEEVLSLPVHEELDEEQLSYICDAISAFRK